MPNILYYGDNLDILRRYIKDESVDLIYLDPPFNSNQDYNVLFTEQDGSKSASQIKAFGDTWCWDQGSSRTYREIVDAGGKVSQVMQAFHTFLGENDMLAYLSMMAPRLVELRRVLKSTGSIYLHCDSRASHYLKLLLDATFGVQHFRNDIRWKRQPVRGAKATSQQFARTSDSILFYTKSSEATWNPQYKEYDENYIKSKFTKKDKDQRLYRIDNIGDYSETSIAEFRKQGRIYDYPSGKVGLIRYLDEAKGEALGDFWPEPASINSQATERLGFPTQKPEALLERIVKASSNEGDFILDPFCGCGTAIAVAQRLKRNWLGIDITNLAITLIKNRLYDMTGGEAKYTVVGEPVTLPDAEALASQDKFQFQWWALGLVKARPAEQKKGADKGIDGRIYFHDEADETKTKQIILSVKGGKLKPDDIRALKGVVDRENAEIGVLITMEQPTKPMKADAAGGGFYHSPGYDQDYPILQILTIEELLNGKRIDMPPQQQVSTTFKKAPRAREEKAPNLKMQLD